MAAARPSHRAAGDAPTALAWLGNSLRGSADLLNRLGDLPAEAALDLQAAGMDVDDARDLGQAQHLAIGNLGAWAWSIKGSRTACTGGLFAGATSGRRSGPPGGLLWRLHGKWEDGIYEIGYLHIDSSEPCHADGKPVMFLAIDRLSNFVCPLP